MNYFQKHFSSFTILITLFSLTAMDVNAQITDVKKTNPLLQRSSLQYQAPPFDKIKDEHFRPAFEYGLKIHDRERLKAVLGAWLLH